MPGLHVDSRAAAGQLLEQQAPRFQALSPAERVQALEDERLSAYARGVKVAELGLYLAATVLECGPGEPAESHRSGPRNGGLAHSVLLEARQLWGVQLPCPRCCGCGWGCSLRPH